METTSVKIFVDAKKKLDELHNQRGVGKVELVSRAIQWLSKQDKTLQAIILGQIEQNDTVAVLDLLRGRLSENKMDAQIREYIKQSSSVPEKTKTDLLKILDYKLPRQTGKQGQKTQQGNSAKVG